MMFYADNNNEDYIFHPIDRAWFIRDSIDELIAFWNIKYDNLIGKLLSHEEENRKDIVIEIVEYVCNDYLMVNNTLGHHIHQIAKWKKEHNIRAKDSYFDDIIYVEKGIYAILELNTKILKIANELSGNVVGKVIEILKNQGGLDLINLIAKEIDQHQKDNKSYE